LVKGKSGQNARIEGDRARKLRHHPSEKSEFYGGEERKNTKGGASAEEVKGIFTVGDGREKPIRERDSNLLWSIGVRVLE